MSNCHRLTNRDEEDSRKILRRSSNGTKKISKFDNLFDNVLNSIIDDIAIEYQEKELTNGLEKKLDFSIEDDQNEIAKKIAKKKKIRDNIFAIKSQTRSIKSSPMNYSKLTSTSDENKSKKTKIIKTNDDLYAETIAKKLDFKDVQSISKFSTFLLM